MRELSPKRAVVLKNIRCVYCRCDLQDGDVTRDHVIARRFVPKGKLNAQWNLIVNACQPCNNKKSDLEDDIAAITLLPDPEMLDTRTSDLIEEVQRRAAGSISRRTRKPVAESSEEIEIKGALAAGVNVSFGLTSPPQIDRARAFELARLHLTALFFMQSYDESTREGGWWLHGFHPLEMAPRSDWGNPVMRSFMTATANWECHLHAVTAEGFFKASTYRHPSEECWAWAVEWNHSLRLVGFFGKMEPAEVIVSGFPENEMRTIQESPTSAIRYRTEIALDEADDILFQLLQTNAERVAQNDEDSI